MIKLFKSSFLRESIVLACILVAIYFSARAVFHEGFFRTIDDITTVRVEHMSRELKRGEWLNNFPVRYGAELSHTYGYFVYLFYAPLVYYAGALSMIILGLSDIMATKLVYVVPLLFGPLIFYWAMRQKLDRLPSLVATLLYTFFPFRGFDSYIRGGVGEAWAMMFLPGVIGSLFLFDKKNKWAPPILSTFLALSIISHNIGGLLILGITVLYGLFLLTKTRSFWISIILSLALTCFFWLPSLSYTQIVKVTQTVDHNGLVTNYLAPLHSLLSPTLSYNIHDKTSPLLAYTLGFSCIVAVLISRSKNTSVQKSLVFWSLLGVITYFMLATESIWLWTKSLSMSRNLQFPWRLLIILSSIIPVSLGLALQKLKSYIFYAVGLLVILGMSSIFLVAFKPEKYSYYYNYNAEDTGPCATSWGEEYLPLWVEECISTKPDFILKFPKVGESAILLYSPIDTTISLTDASSGYLEAQRYYFPGWKIFVDNQEQPLDYRYYKHGTFRTRLDAGNHVVRVVWQKTQLMWIADIVSLLGLIILVGVFIREVKRH